MENSYLNIATGAVYTAANMRAAYNADYLPTVAAGDAPLSFGDWLEEVALCGDYIECPAGAAYMVTVDFECGAEFYRRDDVADIAEDVAAVVDGISADDIAAAVKALEPGSRAYFDFMTVTRIQ